MPDFKQRTAPAPATRDRLPACSIDSPPSGHCPALTLQTKPTATSSEHSHTYGDCLPPARCNQAGSTEHSSRARPMAPARSRAPRKEEQQHTSAAGSPPLRRGDVYCLPNFTCRAAHWYKEEADRQAGTNLAGAVRRQPSRTAKLKPVAAGPYVLAGDEVAALRLRVGGGGGGDGGSGGQGGGQTPRAPEEGAGAATDDSARRDGATDDGSQGRPEPRASDGGALVAAFCARLGTAIGDKTAELEARHKREGIRHICTVADSKWQCLDEEHCRHGLVERCMRWVAPALEQFRPRVRAKMDEYVARAVFSPEAARDRPGLLKELKQRRYAKLKEVTLATVARIAEEWEKRPRAMEEALMLETPTLGRWPVQGFVREDVGAQTVAFAGLVFAVDVCQGETRIMML